MAQCFCPFTVYNRGKWLRKKLQKAYYLYLQRLGYTFWLILVGNTSRLLLSVVVQCQGQCTFSLCSSFAWAVTLIACCLHGPWRVSGQFRVSSHHSHHFLNTCTHSDSISVAWSLWPLGSLVTDVSACSSSFLQVTKHVCLDLVGSRCLSMTWGSLLVKSVIVTTVVIFRNSSLLLPSLSHTDFLQLFHIFPRLENLIDNRCIDCILFFFLFLQTDLQQGHAHWVSKWFLLQLSLVD